jgi:hypothetical protein
MVVVVVAAEVLDFAILSDFELLRSLLLYLNLQWDLQEQLPQV